MVGNYFGTAADCERALAWLQEAKLPLRYGASFVQIDSVCGHLPPEKEQTMLLDKLQAARA